MFSSLAPLGRTILLAAPCWSVACTAIAPAQPPAEQLGTSAQPLDGEAQDCRVREPEARDPSWTCRKASAYPGCVPQADFDTWGCLELDADAELCPSSEPFVMTVYLAHDDVTLDCADQTIDHGWVEGESTRSGIQTPYERSVSDITIRRCHIRDVGRYGIDLKRQFRGDEAALTATQTDLAGPIEGHRNIRIEDTTITRSQRIGIYVGQASRNVDIDRVTIDGSFSGVYIEASSLHTRVANSTFVGSREREGISVDSSQYSIIENNLFFDNGDAINLYHNCGEPRGQVCPVRRPLGASHNIIRFNELDGDHLHVAWRQFKLYGPDRCIGIDTAGYWRDHAADNVIHGNVFHGGSDLDINDGPVVVHSNELMSGTELELGKGQPLGWVDQELEIGGWIAENVIHGGASWDWHDSDFTDLRVVNNHRPDGNCDPDSHNQCGAGQTVVWGRQVVSAGLIAIL